MIIRYDRKTEKDWPHIEFRKSAIHRWGVFALEDIPARKRVVEYRGDKIHKSRIQRFPDMYMFQLNELYYINGKNVARYANHSCAPNCEVSIENNRIWLLSLRRIKAGEEITYNYNYELSEAADYPCRCGAADCVGFILDKAYWDDLKKLQAPARKR